MKFTKISTLLYNETTKQKYLYGEVDRRLIRTNFLRGRNSIIVADTIEIDHLTVLATGEHYTMLQLQMMSDSIEYSRLLNKFSKKSR